MGAVGEGVDTELPLHLPTPPLILTLWGTTGACYERGAHGITGTLPLPHPAVHLGSTGCHHPPTTTTTWCTWPLVRDLACVTQRPGSHINSPSYSTPLALPILQV